MTRRYVETSALLRVLLEGDEALRPALSGPGLFTSALTFLEAHRAVARALRDRRLDVASASRADRVVAAFERACEVMPIGDAVVRRAREAFPAEPVRSLDAIHLASIVVLDAEVGGVEVASCDDRVRRNALALGFALVPVV